VQTVFDLTVEKPVALAEACRIVPPARSGKKTHLSTILRWILRGAKSPTGELVKLEALRIGNRWVTSREALQRFAERLTPRLDGEPPSAWRTLAQRSRASERASRELGKVGI
jgi:hypothetical protein